MAVDNAPPLVVIGMEGLWGTIIMLLIFPIAAVLPGRDLGCIENTSDTFYMVSQSNAIQVRIISSSLMALLLSFLLSSLSLSLLYLLLFRRSRCWMSLHSVFFRLPGIFLTGGLTRTRPMYSKCDVGTPPDWLVLVGGMLVSRRTKLSFSTPHSGFHQADARALRRDIVPFVH